MRIGTNHGSLSDRILNRYGDTPEGMVETRAAGRGTDYGFCRMLSRNGVIAAT